MCQLVAILTVDSHLQRVAVFASLFRCPAFCIFPDVLRSIDGNLVFHLRGGFPDSLFHGSICKICILLQALHNFLCKIVNTGHFVSPFWLLQQVSENPFTKWEETFSLWAKVTVKTASETTDAGITKEVQKLEFLVRQSPASLNINSTNFRILFRNSIYNVTGITPLYDYNNYMKIEGEIRKAGDSDDFN